MVGQTHHTERATVKKPRKRSYHCQHKWTYKDYPECPTWHRLALRLASMALVFLIATVIGLIIHISHLNTCSLSDKRNVGMLGNNETRCCDCVDISSEKQQDRVNSTGKSCPDDWLQKQGKCYKFYMNFKSWIDSEISCAVKKSHLLVIQDKAELDFIQSKIHDGVYFWIGLNITEPQKTWTWLDGIPLHPQLFQVTGRVGGDACALITRKGIFSEKCYIHNYWICQDSSTEDNV
ncbi:killer cell lectin-like receptor subfamily F member 1 isoform X2 [Meriones unguiculatus]|nr:killer cell lectin-like receptor subfamily F member 1 isoform X2 [Meriones unguiculatus]XP_060240260.1 killer cell lectin-like receptor subfamily F member 1 isoform X2 [Meriones unguiculatus]XP_060240261.1 killer cell lectin-like receptor subfamily F member 1 isoform X2 [Meriones unguiculatus]